MLDEERIEELAAEVAAELSRNVKGFGIEDIEGAADGAMLITFSWEQQPFFVEVTINPKDHETDESVRAELRRLLSRAGLRFSSDYFH
jgi:hypothetical protein